MVAPGKSRQDKLAYLDAALKFVKNWRVAIDAGAFVGDWSKVMATRFQKVLAFEPMPDNQSRWLANMAGHPNAELIPKAVGDRKRRVYMRGEGQSKHYATFNGGGGDVEMVTIDSYGLQNVDFIKIDCEGADTLVLRGAEETLLRCRPVVIVESLAKFEARYGLAAMAPLIYLEQLGAQQVAEYRCDHIFVFRV